MSFSKTSIFCLILLMVFIAAPAMAHQVNTISTSDANGGYWRNHTFAENHDGKDNDPAGTTSSDIIALETNHTHLENAPKVTSVNVVNIETAAKTGPPAVPVKNSAVGRTVRPVDSATGDTIDFADISDTIAYFQIKVTFDKDVYDGPGAAASALALESSDFRFTAERRSNPGVDVGPNITFSSAAPVVTGTGNNAVTSKTDYNVTISINQTVLRYVLGDSSSDPAIKASPIDLYIRVNADAAYLRQRLVSGETTDGRASAESTLYSVTIIGALDETAPTLPENKRVVPTAPVDGNLIFSVESDEPLGSDANDLTADDVTVLIGTTAGTATVSKKGNVYTITVPVTTADQYKDVTVTIAKAGVKDQSGNALAADVVLTYEAPDEPDTAGPTVTITSKPDSGAELPKTGALKDQVIFVFTFNEALGTGADAFALGDVKVTDGSKEDFYVDSDNPLVWNLVVMPDDRTTDVTVEITGTVQDTSNNELDKPKSTPAGAVYTYNHYDTTPPKVEIYGLKNTDAEGNITFIFDFDEPVLDFTTDDIDRTNSDVASIVEAVEKYTGPAKEGTTPTTVTKTTDGKDAYTIKVKPTTTGTVSIQIKIHSVWDDSIAKNKLERDYAGSWSPPGPPVTTVPVVTIPKQLDKAPKPEQTIKNPEGYPGPKYLDSYSRDENVITITITDDKGFSDKLEKTDVTVSPIMGDPDNFDFDLTETSATSHTATIKFVPKYSAQFVTVSVAANAVKDNDATPQGNAATSEKFEVAPLITVNPGEYVIIAREHHYVPWTRTNPGTPILSDQATLSLPPHIPTTAPDIRVVTWEHMPDLKVLFERNNPGEGGGALILKRGLGFSNGWKSVLINEVMWATDDGILGNVVRDEQAKQQWIELHNPTSAKAKVFIYARARRDIVDNTDGANGLSDVTHPPSDVVDVVTNYFDGSEGKPGWEVPGEDGNSRTGLRADGTTPADFVSMMRTANDKDGRNKGHWAKSTYAYYTDQTTHTDQARQLYSFVGTPGRVNTFGASRQPHLIDQITSVPSSPIIINEIGNRLSADKAYEWIELRNLSGADRDLRNYRISIVTGVNQHRELYTFGGTNTKIFANGVLLLVASDPRNNDNHPISVGYNIDLPASNQVRGLGDRGLGDIPEKTGARYKVTPFKENLPDNGEFVLILHEAIAITNGTRAANLTTRAAMDPGGHKNNGEYHLFDKVNGVERFYLRFVMDIAGYHPNLTKNPYNNRVSKTDLWPLTSFGAHRFTNNKFEVNKVHQRIRQSTNKGGSGAGADDNNNGKTAFGDAGFTGLGYKRGVTSSPMLGGTPGYHNNAVKNEVGHLTTGQVVISEIMLSQGPAPAPANRKLPQWLELHNTSRTEAVNLAANDGWRLIIEMPSTDTKIGAFKTINFKTKGNVKVIEPNESILVVSGRARSFGSSTHLRSSIIFPTTRVYNVWQEQRNDFGMGNNHLASILPLEGFHIKLVDGKGAISDEIGNIDGHNRTSWYRDIPEWTYPNSVTEEGYRSSLIRIYDNGMPRNGVNMEKSNVIPLGDKTGKRSDMNYAWVHAADTGPSPFYAITHKTWWGIETDHGTPIQRANSQLPVELSAFQPTLEEGKVVVRWTTESELDNAGFNIYRSETRNGEFKQVNAQLIEGAGTTGERNAYEWVDTTAKPDVVYYYQIEDVSFSGERQTLAQSRLKGYVSAKNKLTTRWGELKKTLQ